MHVPKDESEKNNYRTFSSTALRPHNSTQQNEKAPLGIKIKGPPQKIYALFSENFLSWIIRPIATWSNFSHFLLQIGKLYRNAVGLLFQKMRHYQPKDKNMLKSISVQLVFQYFPSNSYMHMAIHPHVYNYTRRDYKAQNDERISQTASAWGPSLFTSVLEFD